MFSWDLCLFSFLLRYLKSKMKAFEVQRHRVITLHYRWIRIGIFWVPKVPTLLTQPFHQDSPGVRQRRKAVITEAPSWSGIRRNQPKSLQDGENTRYNVGWKNSTYRGKKTVTHMYIYIYYIYIYLLRTFLFRSLFRLLQTFPENSTKIAPTRRSHDFNGTPGFQAPNGFGGRYLERPPRPIPSKRRFLNFRDVKHIFSTKLPAQDRSTWPFFFWKCWVGELLFHAKKILRNIEYNHY